MISIIIIFIHPLRFNKNLLISKLQTLIMAQIHSNKMATHTPKIDVLKTVMIIIFIHPPRFEIFFLKEFEILKKK